MLEKRLDFGFLLLRDPEAQLSQLWLPLQQERGGEPKLRDPELCSPWLCPWLPSTLLHLGLGTDPGSPHAHPEPPFPASGMALGEPR